MSGLSCMIAVLLIGTRMTSHPTRYSPGEPLAEPVVIVVPSAWSSPTTKELATTVADSLIQQLNRRRDGQALSLLDALALAGLGPPPSMSCLVARQVATKLRVPRVLCPAVFLDAQSRPVLEAKLVDVPTGAEHVIGPVPATDPASAVYRIVESVSALLPAPPDDM